MSVVSIADTCYRTLLLKTVRFICFILKGVLNSDSMIRHDLSVFNPHDVTMLGKKSV